MKCPNYITFLHFSFILADQNSVHFIPVGSVAVEEIGKKELSFISMGRSDQFTSVANIKRAASVINKSFKWFSSL